MAKSVRSFCSLCCEALAAEYCLTFGGLEGHLALLAALYADCIEHLSCTLLRILLSGTALLASGGLVLKASGCIELLLTCGEHELIATISALQCLVLVHCVLFSLDRFVKFALRRIPTDAFVNQRSPLSYLGHIN